MADGKRPGGLTALAVLNFVFGGLGLIFTLIGILALVALGAVGEAASAETGEPNPFADANMAIVWVSMLIGLAGLVLMIVSGVGYLGQKRFLGRTMGNAYAVTSLASTAIGLTFAAFSFFTIIGLVYPILTLALINGTFKDDLVN